MPPIELAFTVTLFAVLAAIAVVDSRTLRIPDGLNLCLAGLGIAYQASATRGFPFRAVAFATIVFVAFWAVGAGYRHLRGVSGLGFGDVKMAAASALWFDPWNLAIFVLVASLSALVFVAVAAARSGGLQGAARIPFGPFLAVGLAATWLLERSGFATFAPDGVY